MVSVGVGTGGPKGASTGEFGTTVPGGGVKLARKLIFDLLGIFFLATCRVVCGCKWGFEFPFAWHKNQQKMKLKHEVRGAREREGEAAWK